MQLQIFILEDDADRQAVMSKCLAAHCRDYSVQFFNNAPAMIANLESNLESAIAISLDHDLEFLPDDNGKWDDPGTGRDVADYLAEKSSVCPVVIHSTNAPAAVGMEMTLQESNWTTHRVVPFNDLEWISELWIPTMLDVTGDTKNVSQPFANPVIAEAWRKEIAWRVKEANEGHVEFIPADQVHARIEEMLKTLKQSAE